MKRTLVSMLLCLLMLCFAACAVQTAPQNTQSATNGEAEKTGEADKTEKPNKPEKPEKPDKPDKPQKPEKADKADNKDKSDKPAQNTAPLTYTLEKRERGEKDEQGTQLIEGYFSCPSVAFGDKTVEKKINRHFLEESEDYDEDFKGYEEDARMLVKERGAQDFPTYEFTVDYADTRCDAAVTSFTEDSYVFLGGAHGSSIREGVTFDMRTGKDLDLEDISTVSEEQTEKFVLDYLKSALKEKKYTDLGLFDGYEAYLSEVVDEDECWYMTDDAVIIVINDTVIASHAAGMIEVPIPYADFTILKSEYLPK